MKAVCRDSLSEVQWPIEVSLGHTLGTRYLRVFTSCVCQLPAGPEIADTQRTRRRKAVEKS